MRWLTSLFRKRKFEKQMDSELRFHIERKAAGLMRIFLTGVTGFVGSVVAQDLIKPGHHGAGAYQLGSRRLSLMGCAPCNMSAWRPVWPN